MLIFLHSNIYIYTYIIPKIKLTFFDRGLVTSDTNDLDFDDVRHLLKHINVILWFVFFFCIPSGFHIYIYIYILMHKHARTHTHTYIYIYIAIRAYIYMHVYMYVCIFVCACKYIYIYMHTHTHTHTHIYINIATSIFIEPTHWHNVKSVPQWSKRPGFNLRSSHTKD